MYNGHFKVTNWNKRFMEMATLVSTWSKDPSTKCGSVIVDKNNRIVSVGFNGFAKGVRDTEERLNDRELKYSMIIHSEPNAILFAQRDLTDCSIYMVPMCSCARCAAMIIQSGITKVFYPLDIPLDKLKRWEKEFNLAKEMYWEASVDLLAI